MKKYLIVAIGLIVLSNVMQAQIAIRGGLNYSRVSVDAGGPDFGSEPKAGFHLGLQGNINLPGFLSVRPALLYHLKGGKGEDLAGAGDTNLSYFEFPVNLGLSLGNKSLRIIIEGGPYFGYLVNASSELFSDVSDNLRKADWGANFGAVVEFSSLGVGINYSNSLSNIAAGRHLNSAFKLTNGNLALFAYIKF